MLLIIFRCILVFFILLILLRLMGKRQIGEMQPFELVITLIIADLACFPMTDSSIPILYAVISLFAVFIIHQILILLSNKFKAMERIICGSPIMLIEKNKIIIANMEKVNMTANDLLENIRINGMGGFSQVEFAIIETSGKVSFIKSQDKSPTSFAQIVIEEGKIDTVHLEQINYSMQELQDFLHQNSLKAEDIYVLTVDYEKQIFFQKNEGEK